jgi:hypothetical protein
MTFVEIAMLLYCGSFRWPVIVMKQLREKKTDVTRPRQEGNIVKRGDKKKYNGKRKEKKS